MDRRDAARGQDLTAEQRRRLSRDLRWRVWSLAVTALLVVVGLVGGGLLLQGQRPERPVRWGLLVVIVIGVLVFFAGVVAVAWRVRSRSTALERLVLSGDPAAIRRVRRTLSRAEPVADDDLEVAEALVAQSRSQRWLPWVFGASAALNLLGLVVSLLGDEPIATVPLVLRLVGGVVMVVGCVVIVVSRRRLLRGAEQAGLPIDA